MRLQVLNHDKILKLYYLYMSIHWFSTAKTILISFEEILRMENNPYKQPSWLEAIAQNWTWKRTKITFFSNLFDVIGTIITNVQTANSFFLLLCLALLCTTNYQDVKTPKKVINQRTDNTKINEKKKGTWQSPKKIK